MTCDQFSAFTSFLIVAVFFAGALASTVARKWGEK